MLLEKLCEYAELSKDEEPVPSMYKSTAVPWIIELSQEGTCLGVVRTTEYGAESQSKKNDRGASYLTPHLQRSSGVKAKLLVDTGEYVLGIPRETSKPERIKDCQQDFLKRVKECADETKEATVQTILTFLESIQEEPADQVKNKLELASTFESGDVMTFRINGVMPIDLSSVRSFWSDNAVEDKKEGQTMACHLCGEQKKPEERIQFKIKGIPNGQTAGMAIISANSNAFESYGLKASLIAPTCRECSEKFSQAANSLLKSKQNSIRVGPLVYIFWTVGKTGLSLNILSDPKPEYVKALIEAAWKGKQSSLDIQSDKFYAAAFSASGARVAVRDWLDSTVEEVKKNLTRYFLLQQLVDTYGEEGKPLKLTALAGATERDLRDIKTNVPRAFIRTALRGSPLPGWLLSKALNRIRADGRVTRPQAALIKMVLLSDPQFTVKEEDYMVSLNLENKEPAYLCGRLFSVLEEIQKAAIPGAGSTITDRYFGTASSAPASVFGNLLRGAQNHLGKLRKEKRGAYEAIEKRLEEVLADLQGFPNTLSLKEQGLFSLGYYHQRAGSRAAAMAHKKAKQSTE